MMEEPQDHMYMLDQKKTYRIVLLKNAGDGFGDAIYRSYAHCTDVVVGVGAVKFTYRGKMHVCTNIGCEVVEEDAENSPS